MEDVLTLEDVEVEGFEELIVDVELGEVGMLEPAPPAHALTD